MPPTTPSTTVSSATSTWTSPLCLPGAAPVLLPVTQPGFCVQEGRAQLQASEQRMASLVFKNIYLVVSWLKMPLLLGPNIVCLVRTCLEAPHAGSFIAVNRLKAAWVLESAGFSRSCSPWVYSCPRDVILVPNLELNPRPLHGKCQILKAWSSGNFQG